MGKCCYLGKRKLYELVKPLLSQVSEIEDTLDSMKCKDFSYRKFKGIEEIKIDFLLITSQFSGKWIHVEITDGVDDEDNLIRIDHTFSMPDQEGVYQYHSKFSYLVH